MFDYATLLMLVHELDRSEQALVMREALRLAERGIIIDAVAPLPRNAGALGIRFVEATFGRDHHRNFWDYQGTGGINGVLEASGLPINVEHSSLFLRDCREAVMVSPAS